MGRYREKTIPELLKQTPRLKKQRATIVLEAKTRMQGPFDAIEADMDFKALEVCTNCRNHLDRSQVQTCNFCGAEHHTFCLEMAENIDKGSWKCFKCKNESLCILPGVAVQNGCLAKPVKKLDASDSTGGVSDSYLKSSSPHDFSSHKSFNGTSLEGIDMDGLHNLVVNLEDGTSDKELIVEVPMSLVPTTGPIQANVTDQQQKDDEASMEVDIANAEFISFPPLFAKNSSVGEHLKADLSQQDSRPVELVASVAKACMEATEIPSMQVLPATSSLTGVEVAESEAELALVSGGEPCHLSIIDNGPLGDASSSKLVSAGVNCDLQEEHLTVSQDVEMQHLSGDSEDRVCEICGDVGYEDFRAICANCRATEHVYCVESLLFPVPDEGWQCKTCTAKQRINEAARHFDVGVSSLHKAREQSLAGNARSRLSALLQKRRLGSERRWQASSLQPGAKRYASEGSGSVVSCKKQAIENSGVAGGYIPPLKYGTRKDGSFKPQETGKTANMPIRTSSSDVAMASGKSLSHSTHFLSDQSTVMPKARPVSSFGVLANTSKGSGNVLENNQSPTCVSSKASKPNVIASTSKAGNASASNQSVSSGLKIAASPKQSDSMLLPPGKPKSTLKSLFVESSTREVQDVGTQGVGGQLLVPNIVGPDLFEEKAPPVDSGPKHVLAHVASLKAVDNQFDGPLVVLERNQGDLATGSLSGRKSEDTIAGMEILADANMTVISSSVKFLKHGTADSLGIDEAILKSETLSEFSGDKLPDNLRKGTFHPGVCKRDPVKAVDAVSFDTSKEIASLDPKLEPQTSEQGLIARGPINNLNSVNSTLSIHPSATQLAVPTRECSEALPLPIVPTSHPTYVPWTPVSAMSFIAPYQESSKVYPEAQIVWEGSLEVGDKGNSTTCFHGLQANPSNRALPKVHEAAKKLEPLLLLEELPRGSEYNSWPVQFQKSPPITENIALYFFARTKESHTKFYLPLVARLIKNDLALKGYIEDAELLIFPSNLLPAGSQCWNNFMFLWAVFRDRKPISKQLPHNMPLGLRQADISFEATKQLLLVSGVHGKVEGSNTLKSKTELEETVGTSRLKQGNNAEEAVLDTMDDHAFPEKIYQQQSTARIEKSKQPDICQPSQAVEVDATDLLSEAETLHDQRESVEPIPKVDLESFAHGGEAALAAVRKSTHASVPRTSIDKLRQSSPSQSSSLVFPISSNLMEAHGDAQLPYKFSPLVFLSPTLYQNRDQVERGLYKDIDRERFHDQQRLRDMDKRREREWDWGQHRWNGDWEREKEKDRNRERERGRERERERKIDSDRDRGRERDRERELDRERERERARDQERERSRLRDREGDKARERVREEDRCKGQDREWRERDRSRGWDRGKDWRSRGRDSEKDRQRERGRDHLKERDAPGRDRGRTRHGDMERDSADKSTYCYPVSTSPSWSPSAPWNRSRSRSQSWSDRYYDGQCFGSSSRSPDSANRVQPPAESRDKCQVSFARKGKMIGLEKVVIQQDQGRVFEQGSASRVLTVCIDDLNIAPKEFEDDTAPSRQVRAAADPDTQYADAAILGRVVEVGECSTSDGKAYKKPDSLNISSVDDENDCLSPRTYGVSQESSSSFSLPHFLSNAAVRVPDLNLSVTGDSIDPPLSSELPVLPHLHHGQHQTVGPGAAFWEGAMDVREPSSLSLSLALPEYTHAETSKQAGLDPVNTTLQLFL